METNKQAQLTFTPQIENIPVKLTGLNFRAVAFSQTPELTSVWQKKSQAQILTSQRVGSREFVVHNLQYSITKDFLFTCQLN